MRPHGQRLLVALAGVPLVLLVVLAAPPRLLGLVVAAVAVLSQREFYRLEADRLPPAARRLGLVLGGMVGVAAVLDGESALLGATVAGLFALFLLALRRPEEGSTAAARIGLLFLGLAYGPVLLGHLTLLRALPGGGGEGWVLLSLAAAWGGDTAAFYVGRIFGRHRLSPAISPGKTWEGAAAGLAGTLIGTAAVRTWLLPGLPVRHLAVIALLAAVVGQLGDLCESLVKRGAGVKDSGAVLPGHGGLLDRLDSLLFVAPLVYYYARMLETWR